MLKRALEDRGETRLLRGFIALSALAALWAWSCSSEQAPVVPPPVDAEQIRAVVNSFDGASIRTLDLEAIVEAGRGAIPVLADLLAQGDRATRWAALLGMAALGHQRNAAGAVLPHLKSALSDPDISVKVTAAELVASFGDPAGLPVLIDAVDSDEILRPAEPPTSVCTQAVRVLGHYTGEVFTEEADWQTWWDTNQASLKWDPDHERFY
jgi:HEAT repeat protein